MIEKSKAQREREAARPKGKATRRKRAPLSLTPGTGKPYTRKRRVVITDNLDAPRLLRASPHSADYEEIRASFDEEGVPHDVGDPAAIAEAGEESAYTTSPSSALSGEPEAVSREEQERQTRASRAEREKVVMTPLYAVDKELEKLEALGHYKPGKVRFIRKLLNQLGEDAMRSAVDSG